MSDYYTEQLVKKKADGKDIVIKILLIFCTVFSFFLVLLMPFLMILPVLLIVLDVFLFRRLDLEYAESLSGGQSAGLQFSYAEYPLLCDGDF